MKTQFYSFPIETFLFDCLVMQDTTDAPGAKQEANAKFRRLNVHLEIQASYIPVFTNNMKVVSILIL